MTFTAVFHTFYKKSRMDKLNYLKDRLIGGGARSKAVKRNIVGGLMIKGISILISLFIVPLTLGYVNSEMYGIWLTMSSIMMWMYFFDVGFTLGLRNRLTEAIAQGDYEKGRKLVSTTYVMMALIFLPLCTLLELLLPLISLSSFLNVGEEYEVEMQHAMSLLVLFFCLQMITNVFASVVSAFQKVALSSLFGVIGQALSLVIIYLLTKFSPPSLSYLACAISASPILITLVASMCFFRGKFKKVAPRLKGFEREYVRDLFSLGGKFFIIQLQVVILYQCTNILISNISGPEDVTVYNIAYKYLSVAMMAFTIIVNPLWSAMTDAYSRKDFAWMRGIYKKMTYLYLVFAVGILFMIAVSPMVYKLWVGDKVQIPFVMTVVVGLYVMIHSWDTLQVQLINGVGKVRLQSYVTIVGLFFHIPMSLFISKYWGAIGVLVSMIIINVIYVLFFTTQIRKIINDKAKGIWAE